MVKNLMVKITVVLISHKKSAEGGDFKLDSTHGTDAPFWNVPFIVRMITPTKTDGYS